MSLLQINYKQIHNADVNLAAYATGDGTTNDYAAIQTALAAARATNTRLFVPEGTYAYATTITLSDYDYIYGVGLDKSILLYTGTENALVTGSSNVLEDIAIQGTVAANTGIVNGLNDNGASGIVSKNIFNRISISQFKRQGQVSSVACDRQQGTGYDGTTAIVFSAPTSGVTATGTPVIVGGAITGVTITNRGSGYTSVPTITTTGAGSGAKIRASINATGLLIKGGVTGTVKDCNITRNWRGVFATYGGLNTTWSFYDNDIGYTEGSQGYWNGGPCIEMEGMQAAIFNNTLTQTCGEEAVKLYSRNVEDVVFNVNYYEATNLAKRGNIVSLIGDAVALYPWHVTFNNDLIGFQPTYPLPTVNGYPSTLTNMAEFIYSFDYAIYCEINQPKFISENYYYSIYSGANALVCAFNAPNTGSITNQDQTKQTQGIKLIPNTVGATTPNTLYGIAYSTVTGPVTSLNSTTPSVSSNNKFYKTANTSSTAITTFLDAVEGQEIQVYIGENYTSFNVSSTTLFLKERVTNLLGATINFIYENGAWTEQYRNYVENHITTVAGSNDQFFASSNDAIVQTINISITGTTTATGQISLNAGAHTVTIVSDPSAILANSNTAGKFCFYYNLGQYRGFNNTGSTLTIQTTLV